MPLSQKTLRMLASNPIPTAPPLAQSEWAALRASRGIFNYDAPNGMVLTQGASTALQNIAGNAGVSNVGITAIDLLGSNTDVTIGPIGNTVTAKAMLVPSSSVRTLSVPLHPLGASNNTDIFIFTFHAKTNVSAKLGGVKAMLSYADVIGSPTLGEANPGLSVSAPKTNNTTFATPGAATCVGVLYAPGDPMPTADVSAVDANLTLPAAIQTGDVEWSAFRFTFNPSRNAIHVLALNGAYVVSSGTHYLRRSRTTITPGIFENTPVVDWMDNPLSKLNYGALQISGQTASSAAVFADGIVALPGSAPNQPDSLMITLMQEQARRFTVGRRDLHPGFMGL
jgi:hypothetical protein